nr:MAG TPA: hypothetical protein [Caudoviricetes sp.]
MPISSTRYGRSHTYWLITCRDYFACVNCSLYPFETSRCSVSQRTLLGCRGRGSIRLQHSCFKCGRAL